MKAALLLKIKRSTFQNLHNHSEICLLEKCITEREHSGFICLVDKDENILSEIGESRTSFFLRSCAKPFQALPIITSGTYQKFGLTLEELAVCCASHTGSNKHTELVKSILDKIGLKEKDFQCGVHDPIDVDTNHNLIKHNLKPSQLHNNCSGKHAGMLGVCLQKGWPIENYLSFEHPLQKEILSVIQHYCLLDDNIKRAIDGCSAPVYAMPLYKMGAGFLKLFLSKDGELIKNAYLKHPYLIGGTGRLDSIIIKASHNRLVAKVGAEGLCIVINPHEEKALVVKILDSNIQARSIAVIECLKQLGWLSKQELSCNEISKIYDLEIKNLNNIPVGQIEPVFKL